MFVNLMFIPSKEVVMKRMSNIRYITVLLIMLLIPIFIIGCPPIKEQSNQDIYYQALGFWQDTYENFRLIYDDASEVEQQEMLPTMELLLNTKQLVLNPWKTTFATGDSEEQYSKTAEWKKTKNKLILEVVNKYFPKEEGG